MTKILSVLALAAAAAVTASARVEGDDFLNFNTQAIGLETGDGEVQITLKEKPTADTTVYYEAKHTRFDKCSLKFTPENWNKPQTLHIVSENGAHEREPIQFSAASEACDQDKKVHRRKCRVPTKRTKPRGAVCAAHGDPHYTAWSGHKFDYMGAGYFYLVKSDVLTVQVLQSACGKGTSVVTAVAVRYGNTAYVIDSTVDKHDDILKGISGMEDIVMSRTRGKHSTFVASLRAGSKVTTDVWLGKAGKGFINVTVELGGRTLSTVTGGLCGAESDKRGEYTAPNGRKYNRLQDFGEASKVPDSENIFKCKLACADAGRYKRLVDRNVAQCKIPALDKIKCDVRPPRPTYTPEPPKPTSTPTPPKPEPPKATPEEPKPEKPKTPKSTASSTTTSSSSTTTSTSTTVAPVTLPSPPVNPYPTPSSSSSTSTTSTTVTPSSTSTSSSTSSSSSTTVAPVTLPSPPVNPYPTPSSTASSTTVAPVTLPSPQPSPPVPYKPVCPPPVIVLPVPPGCRQVTKIPTYTAEPRPPVVTQLPEPPKEVVDKCKAECAARIRPIDGCPVDAQDYVRACERDAAGQMHPDNAYAAANLAYTRACARHVLAKCESEDQGEAEAAKETARKYQFGNTPCSDDCKQCTYTGCILCKDEGYEVQSGKCVPKQARAPEVAEKVEEYYQPPAVQQPLAAEEVVPCPGGKSPVDPAPAAYVNSESVENAIAGQSVSYSPAAEGTSETTETSVETDSASGRFKVSAVLGAVLVVPFLV